MKPEPLSSAGAATAALRERSRKVRSRLARSLLLLTIAAVVLCVLVVWQRDGRRVDAARRRIRSAFAPVARYLDDHGTLPIDFPYPNGDPAPHTSEAFTYVEPGVIRWAVRDPEPVVIGYGRLKGLIASPDGHAVMMYHNGRLWTDWLTPDELEDRLAEQRALAGATSGR